MAKELPSAPNLEHLKKQAKSLQSAHRRRDPQAAELIRFLHPAHHSASIDEVFATSFTLADAQLSLARDYGFASWPKLRHYVEQQANPQNPDWTQAVLGKDYARLRELLRTEPALADSLHTAFEDPFRTVKKFPVATLLYAAAGSPCQTVQCWATRAEYSGDLEMVKLLIDAGADPNIHSHHGRPLCWVSQPDVAAYLVEHGADLNLEHDNGGTPLNFTLWQADPRRMKLLVDLGADPKWSCPSTGESYLHEAAAASEPTKIECLQLILAAGADPNHICHVNARLQNYQVDKVLTGKSLVAESPLHRAAVLGNVEAIRSLLQYGADPQIRDAAGEIPCDWGRQAGRTDDVLKLLRP